MGPVSASIIIHSADVALPVPWRTSGRCLLTYERRRAHARRYAGCRCVRGESPPGVSPVSEGVSVVVSKCSLKLSMTSCSGVVPSLRACSAKARSMSGVSVMFTSPSRSGRLKALSAGSLVQPVSAASPESIAHHRSHPASSASTSARVGMASWAPGLVTASAPAAVP